VGDARAGAAHVEKTCAQCHSAAGDLQGIATSSRIDGAGWHARGRRGLGRNVPHGHRSPARHYRLAASVSDTRHSRRGLLTTTGRLIVGGDTAGNLVAHDAESGAPLWHSRIGQVTNAPITYKLGGRQYLLVASDNRLYAFTLY
jgi:outer membrane protein assembly factor BamB